MFAEEDSIQISLEGDLRVLGQPGDVELLGAAVAEVLDQGLTGLVSLVMPDCDQGGQELRQYMFVVHTLFVPSQLHWFISLHKQTFYLTR